MPPLVLVPPIVFLPEAKLLSLPRMMMVISPLEPTMLAELSLTLETPMTFKLVLPDSVPNRLISTVKLLMLTFLKTAFLLEPLMTKEVRALWMMSVVSLTPALMIFSPDQLSSINSMTSTTLTVKPLTAVPTTSPTKILTLRRMIIITMSIMMPMTITMITVTIISTKPITVIMISMMITVMIAALTVSVTSRTITTPPQAATMVMEDATRAITPRLILTPTVLFTVAIVVFTVTTVTAVTTVTDTDTATTATDTTDTATTDTTPGENNSFNPFGEE